MDNETHPGDELPEEAELSGTLRETFDYIRQQDVPEDRLARFLKRARQIPSDPGTAHLPSRARRDSSQTTRGSRMFYLATRGLIAASAAALLAAAGLWMLKAPGASGATLAAAMQKTLSADTVQMKITRDGQAGEIWLRPGRQLRWNRPDGTYQIAREGRIWTVDERANRAASQASSLFQEKQPGAELFGLMSIPPEKEMLEAKPVEQVQRDGRKCDLYRWEKPGKEGTLRVEATVEVQTGLLQSLEAMRETSGRREPIGRLDVVARNTPMAEDLFVVGDTLTEDGRIGKVTDVQGVVALRPATSDRWTPLAERMLLRLGDWARTDLRGANAVSLRLVKETEVVLGPGTLVELVSPRQIRIADGELRVTASKRAPVEITGPDGQKVTVEGKQLYRVQAGKLARIEKEPLWLRGYEGKTANESIGSLVAKVDGRDVPLTVGYHKVRVDICDQIARTTIEESFVNHTNGTLEGVFHFPLPQDASIAGFGMWIGNELVEADVVEKERAREIYEEILRERRDPGLLEWTGGNIFKARVFPIWGHSEKRIKITYTQVLPLKGSAYRYQYALQSELLKQHPLRQLEIDVKVNSAVPLKAISSPTHLTRNAQTAHSGHLEFSAQQYTPTQDFEVVVEVDGRQESVVMIPHRRGNDGYFMVQLTLPAPGGDQPSAGARQRELLPTGEPLELVILADTSASMDAASRAAQAELVAALLGSLTAKDRFNLATFDVDCRWAFDRVREADGKTVAAAREFLAGRTSLGWTDLDKAFAAVFPRCGANTRVVYIGDGIVTACGAGVPPAQAGRDDRSITDGRRDACTTADPVAFAGRLRRMAEGKPGTFHAVAVSPSFEPGVMKAIAAIGGGSLRQVTGLYRPAAVARDLLAEMTQPALRDLKVDLRGLRTARVYPAELPNLPLGTQQIILGRYLPEGRDQAGEIVVTGTQAGKPVKFAAKVSLKDAEQGNSFIPRLWARMHLDALLEQGATSVIRDEIIALSEEYHIITPYTSFLVLESDADRERFKVKRRFQMRDGEKFFAQGLANANWELVQQQMKRAGTWRMGLRRDVLRQLSSLGRYPLGGRSLAVPGEGGGFRKWTKDSLVNGEEFFRYDASTGGKNGRLGLEGDEKGWLMPGADVVRLDKWTGYEGEGQGQGQGEGVGEGKGVEPATESKEREDNLKLVTGVETILPYPVLSRDRMSEPLNAPMPVVPWSLSYEGAGKKGKGERYFGSADGKWVGNDLGLADEGLIDVPFASLFRHRAQASRSSSSVVAPASWPNTLFPVLYGHPGPSGGPVGKKPWPADARALAQRLRRTGQVAAAKDGLRIEVHSQSFDPRWHELSSESREVILTSSRGWLLRVEADQSPTTINWCDAHQRGVLSVPFQLGRVWPSPPANFLRPLIPRADGMDTALDVMYANYRAELKPQGEGRTLLVLKSDSNPLQEIHFLVDTARDVVLRREIRSGSSVTSTMTYSDFVEVAGAWWPGRMESTDAEGRRVNVMTQKITAIPAGGWQGQWKEQLAPRDAAQLIRDPLPTVDNAKRALAEGKASIEDQLVLMLHFQATQQWDRVLEHLAKAEQLAAGKPGMRWLRTMVLSDGRRREEVKKRYMEEAKGLREAGPGILVSDQHFLVLHTVNQCSSILEANEMLALLDVLRPVFARQPAHVRGLKAWGLLRLNRLDQVGRSQEARQLLEQLARDNPRDYGLQEQHARRLFNVGEYEAAYRWLDRALSSDVRWLPNEEESLRNTYADLLRSQGRYEELVKFLGEWLARKPDATPHLYQQYLSALVWSDRADEANRLVAQWLAEGIELARRPDALPAPVQARLQAVVSQALGIGFQLHSSRLDEQWLRPLADAAMFFARHPSYGHIADQIMSAGQFQQSDEARKVRKLAMKILREEMDKLSPYQISRLLGWVRSGNPAVEPQQWKQLAAGLRERWGDELDKDVKHSLGQSLYSVLAHLGVPEQLAFLREQMEKGPEQYRTSYASQLFEMLLVQPWSAEYENEAFSLLERLSNSGDPLQRLAAAVQALYRLTDRMVPVRFDARMRAIEHQEKLTRTELQAKKEENLKLARQEFSDHLRKEMAKRQGPLAAWLNVERLYLDIQMGRDLNKVAEDCFELLGPPPHGPRSPSEKPKPEDRIGAALRGRGLAMLMNLAARKEVKTELPGRVLAYLEAYEGVLKENPRKEGPKLSEDEEAARNDAQRAIVNSCRFLQYQLLIAPGPPQDLEKKLREWIGQDPTAYFWRRSLAQLLAEQGKIREAIELFEKIRAADELTAAEHRTLADWYMVVSERDKHEQALIAAFKTTDDWRLQQWISARLRPWQRTDQPPPRELDREVLLAFAALFEKSSYPQNHLHVLRDFYQTTRDFRLLAGLSDAVIGHTAGQVYPFVQGMGQVLAEIRDEATADSLVEQIAKTRARAKTPVDQRALDLLEVQVERRAAELLNQPGPHIQKALGAMERAWKREWSAGEPRLIADLLASLGAISQPQLSGEQLRELETLHRQAAPGSSDRMFIAYCVARTYWAYKRSNDAIDLLSAALDEHQAASGGVLPAEDQSWLATLVEYLWQQGHFARAERVLLDQLKRPANQQQSYWLTEHLYDLYRITLDRGGEVSLGSGQVLYRAVEKKFVAAMDTPDENHRYSMVNRLCTFYRSASYKRIPGVADDVRAFAFQRLPDLLKRQRNNYQSLVSDVAGALQEIAGPRDGLLFLVERAEKEPKWFRYNNQDAWNQYGHRMADCRKQAPNLGPDLEGRLLRIVLAELRQDLQTRQSRNRWMYQRDYNYFWAEKADVFAQTAEEVLAKNRQSGAAVLYIADYLYNGLARFDRAIEILQDAHRREILDEYGQLRLVNFLQGRNRYAESAALLEPLVDRRPDNLGYRIYLMRAYYHTKRPNDLLSLLEKTDKIFHQGNQWQENVMVALAEICLETQLFQQSAGYWQEAISLHQRTAPRRGIGDGTLSNYYRQQAGAFSGLKKTAEAVDAACGAIVSWGPTHQNRRYAIDSLQAVLRSAPDLDAFAALLDHQTAETHEEKPIVRKAMGQIYLEKQQYARAAVQLSIALELQPNDAETHRALVECYDRQGDKQGVIEQLLRGRELARRDIKLYEDLGKRFDALGRPEEAERAYTSIVEVLPSESESHTLLAETRQRQNRWDEAIVQWEQVARIRSLEPTGLLKLAEAQIHEQRWEDVSATLAKLRARGWPPRFGDVSGQIRNLEQRVPPGGKP